MSSTSPKTNPLPAKRRRYSQYSYSAQEKAQAVLSVWTERASPAEICRQLNINWVTFQQWQQRAMEGMLQALTSHVNLARGGALSPRLQNLLSKHQQATMEAKVSSRLQQVQNKIASTPENAAQKP